MYIKTAMKQSTADCSPAIERLKYQLQRADAIIIGAGAGLSAAAGHTYQGERFENNFADFIAKYQYRDMYSAGFYPYPTAEEYWAYWSRHITLNRYAEGAPPLYTRLLKLLNGKNVFILTTNVDHCFQKAGFVKQRLFYTQGDYGLWQCAKPCHNKTYDNEGAIRHMVLQQSDRQIPSHLLPLCPQCGGPMANNLRSDNRFVEDEGWHLAAKRYEEFIHSHWSGHMLFLELGVGGNTPGIIKYPFWRMTYQNPRAVYACVNAADAIAPKEIEDRAICIQGDIRDVLHANDDYYIMC